jgi:hypothetical protein
MSGSASGRYPSELSAPERRPALVAERLVVPEAMYDVLRQVADALSSALVSRRPHGAEIRSGT